MALSKLIIANNALQLLGGKQLTTFGESTTPGNAVTNVYDSNRDATLKECPWSFAIRRVALVDITLPTSTPSAWVTATAYAVGATVSSGGYNYACVVANTSAASFATDLTAGKWVPMADVAIAMTDDQMARVYTLPTGYLRAFQITGGASFQTENMIITGASGAVATAVILSDTASLKMKYVYQCDDPTLYTSEFAKALWTRLAYELSFFISEGDKKRESLLVEYNNIWLPKAKSIDSAQGTPIQPNVYEWEQARLGSGRGIFPPVPGAATWVSVW